MNIRRYGSKKMLVIGLGSYEVLYSYDTPVGLFVPGRGRLVTNEFHSVTTSGHINEWLGRRPDASEKVDQEVIETIIRGIDNVVLGYLDDLDIPDGGKS